MTTSAILLEFNKFTEKDTTFNDQSGTDHQVFVSGTIVTDGDQGCVLEMASGSKITASVGDIANGRGVALLVSFKIVNKPKLGENCFLSLFDNSSGGLYTGINLPTISTAVNGQTTIGTSLTTTLSNSIYYSAPLGSSFSDNSWQDLVVLVRNGYYYVASSAGTLNITNTGFKNAINLTFGSSDSKLRISSLMVVSASNTNDITTNATIVRDQVAIYGKGSTLFFLENGKNSLIPEPVLKTYGEFKDGERGMPSTSDLFDGLGISFANKKCFLAPWTSLPVNEFTFSFWFSGTSLSLHGIYDNVSFYLSSEMHALSVKCINQLFKPIYLSTEELNEWVKVVLCRKGTTAKLFVNGELIEALSSITDGLLNKTKENSLDYVDGNFFRGMDGIVTHVTIDSIYREEIESPTSSDIEYKLPNMVNSAIFLDMTQGEVPVPNGWSGPTALTDSAQTTPVILRSQDASYGARHKKAVKFTNTQINLEHDGPFLNLNQAWHVYIEIAFPELDISSGQPGYTIFEATDYSNTTKLKAYLANWGGNKTKLYIFFSGVSTEYSKLPSTIELSHSEPLFANRWYSIFVERINGRVNLFIDNTLVASINVYNCPLEYWGDLNLLAIGGSRDTDISISYQGDMAYFGINGNQAVLDNLDPLIGDTLALIPMSVPASIEDSDKYFKNSTVNIMSSPYPYTLLKKVYNDLCKDSWNTKNSWYPKDGWDGLANCVYNYWDYGRKSNLASSINYKYYNLTDISNLPAEYDPSSDGSHFGLGYGIRIIHPDENLVKYSYSWYSIDFVIKLDKDVIKDKLEVQSHLYAEQTFLVIHMDNYLNGAATYPALIVGADDLLRPTVKFMGGLTKNSSDVMTLTGQYFLQDDIETHIMFSITDSVVDGFKIARLFIDGILVGYSRYFTPTVNPGDTPTAGGGVINNLTIGIDPANTNKRLYGLMKDLRISFAPDAFSSTKPEELKGFTPRSNFMSKKYPTLELPVFEVSQGGLIFDPNFIYFTFSVATFTVGTGSSAKSESITERVKASAECKVLTLYKGKTELGTLAIKLSLNKMVFVLTNGTRIQSIVVSDGLKVSPEFKGRVTLNVAVSTSSVSSDTLLSKFPITKEDISEVVSVSGDYVLEDNSTYTESVYENAKVFSEVSPDSEGSINIQITESIPISSALVGLQYLEVSDSLKIVSDLQFSDSNGLSIAVNDEITGSEVSLDSSVVKNTLSQAFRMQATAVNVYPYQSVSDVVKVSATVIATNSDSPNWGVISENISVLDDNSNAINGQASFLEKTSLQARGSYPVPDIINQAEVVDEVYLQRIRAYDPYYSDILLMMHFEVDNYPHPYYDSASGHCPIAIPGDEGRIAWYSAIGDRSFAGNGQYSFLMNTGTKPFDLSGNFTIEFWVKVQVGTIPLQTLIADANNRWAVTYYHPGNQLSFQFVGENDSVLNSTTYAQVDTHIQNLLDWTHIAIVHDANGYRMYQNGDLDSNRTDRLYNLPAPADPSKAIVVGRDYLQSGAASYFNLDELLIHKRAKYTTNFVPDVDQNPDRGPTDFIDFANILEVFSLEDEPLSGQTFEDTLLDNFEVSDGMANNYSETSSEELVVDSSQEDAIAYTEEVIESKLILCGADTFAELNDAIVENPHLEINDIISNVFYNDSIQDSGVTKVIYSLGVNHGDGLWDYYYYPEEDITALDQINDSSLSDVSFSEELSTVELIESQRVEYTGTTYDIDLLDRFRILDPNYPKLLFSITVTELIRAFFSNVAGRKVSASVEELSITRPNWVFEHMLSDGSKEVDIEVDELYLANSDSDGSGLEGSNVVEDTYTLNDRPKIDSVTINGITTYFDDFDETIQTAITEWELARAFRDLDSNIDVTSEAYASLLAKNTVVDVVKLLAKVVPSSDFVGTIIEEFIEGSDGAWPTKLESVQEYLRILLDTSTLYETSELIEYNLKFKPEIETAVYTSDIVSSAFSVVTELVFGIIEELIESMTLEELTNVITALFSKIVETINLKGRLSHGSDWHIVVSDMLLVIDEALNIFKEIIKDRVLTIDDLRVIFGVFKNVEELLNLEGVFDTSADMNNKLLTNIQTVSKCLELKFYVEGLEDSITTETSLSYLKGFTENLIESATTQDDLLQALLYVYLLEDSVKTSAILSSSKEIVDFLEDYVFTSFKQIEDKFYSSSVTEYSGINTFLDTAKEYLQPVEDSLDLLHDTVDVLDRFSDIEDSLEVIEDYLSVFSSSEEFEEIFQLIDELKEVPELNESFIENLSLLEDLLLEKREQILVITQIDVSENSAISRISTVLNADKVVTKGSVFPELVVTKAVTEIVNIISYLYNETNVSIEESSLLVDNLNNLLVYVSSTLSEYLSLSSNLSTETLASLTELVTTLDSLNITFTKDVVDAINLDNTLLSLVKVFEGITDIFSISENSEANTVGLYFVSDGLDIRSLSEYSSVYNRDILDGFFINIVPSSVKDRSLFSGDISPYLASAFSSPSNTDIPIADISAYSLFTENNSVTTYSNFDFTGSAIFNDLVLLIKSIGLFKYGAITDNTVPITSIIQTSAMDFGITEHKQLPSVYLGLESSSSFVLKVRVDGRGEVYYKLNKFTNGLQTQKVPIGKGLIGRYFQFELVSSSDIFDLETIEFYPIALRRKI